ncbi:uncharacterized protein LOC142241441 [Haematobia irritans]|uniref:uncharacterized protein LOC142241441 n=1 Tax=Haematobia irritans TaxID=7368 RepID=UPI003F503C66
MISNPVYISILAILLLRLAYGSGSNWSYDILSVEVKYDNPDVINASLKETRVARGVYLVNGIFDVKQDLTDDCELGMDIFFSPSGLNSSYFRTPFAIARSKLSYFFNQYYKPIAMKSLTECTDNSPYIEDVFRPPLTKRLITFTNCTISTENMPTYAKPGYYHIVFNYYQQCAGLCIIDVFVKGV